MLVIIVLIFVKSLYGIQQNNDEDIVGGKNTSISQVPYQAALIWNGYAEPICGGAIVSDKVVVTAAHCVIGKTAIDFRIKVGSSKLSTGGSIHNVTKILIHDRFNFPHYDIAIIAVQNRFKFSKNVKPIELALSEPKPDSKAIVSGWGYLNDYGSATDVLKSVMVTVQDRKQCGEIYGFAFTSDILCAGNLEAKGSPCNGDSGSPLVSNRKLVGLVSFRNAKGCEVDYNSGYCNVASVKDWLVQNIYKLRET